MKIDDFKTTRYVLSPDGHVCRVVELDELGSMGSGFKVRLLDEDTGKTIEPRRSDMPRYRPHRRIPLGAI